MREASNLRRERAFVRRHHSMNVHVDRDKFKSDNHSNVGYPACALDQLRVQPFSTKTIMSLTVGNKLSFANPFDLQTMLEQTRVDPDELSLLFISIEA